MFANTVYVKVYADRMELRAIESGKTEVAIPEVPYESQRLLVGSFNVAEKALRQGKQRLSAGVKRGSGGRDPADGKNGVWFERSRRSRTARIGERRGCKEGCRLGGA